ncbi:molybdopterin-dependent oxidoreductase [Streptacidiphilus carbonis]|uniref:molybdopterin-dependent oxidoreductase n=1 Tax=Streptacidiphilus carbonis TaxID=105422 RepID=UPI000B125446|nr:molybdopterin-dependent oxidoreductase [Streptacidiphilus carbonis]
MTYTTRPAHHGSRRLPRPDRQSRGGRLLRALFGALSGLVAAFAALAVAELAAVPVRPQASPVTAVGESVIDRTPGALKDYAVRNFGTNDKLVLQLGILVLLALFALGLGLLTLRWRRVGSAGVLAFGLLGAVSAMSRPDAQRFDAVPSVIGAVVGAAVLFLLAGRLTVQPEAPSWQDGGNGPDDSGRDAAGSEFDRRGFVLTALSASAVSLGAGLLGQKLNAVGTEKAAASRAAISIPTPRASTSAAPVGVDLKVPGLSPFITPNPSFYRVDTALVVPTVDANTWRLRIHGTGVAKELDISYKELVARGVIDRDITVMCVSDEVGGNYIGNARWTGVPLAPLLRQAGVVPPSKGGPADQLVARSVDGMTIGTPVEAVLDGRDALLAVGMNGEPLPFAHGFPVRMVVPGLYGYVSACKWLQELELTRFTDFDAYWARRDWSAQAPIKTESRIDTPKSSSKLTSGKVAVAGVAWAQHKGIAKVEVRVDGGAWHTADLSAQDSVDTWRQWVWQWPATPGPHRLEVRATDRTGYIQTEQKAATRPNGATGFHNVAVNVA